MSGLLDSLGAGTISLHVAAYLLQVAVLCGVGLTIARGFVTNAALRYHVLFATWVAVMALPLASGILLHVGFSSAIQGRVISAAAASELEYMPIVSRVDDAQSVAIEPSVTWKVASWGTTLFGASWGIGVLIGYVRVVSSYLRLRAIAGQSELVDVSSPLAKACRLAAKQVGVQTPFEVRISADCMSPAVVGFRLTHILFPQRLMELPDERLRHIALHEMAHVARRDQFVVLLQSIVDATLWIHPFVRLLNRQLARAREEVCDNYVLRHNDKRAYGYTLLDVAESAVAPTLSLATGLLNGNWSLEDRVSQILNQRRKTMTKAKLQHVCTVTAAAAVLTMLMAVTQPAWGQDDVAKGPDPNRPRLLEGPVKPGAPSVDIDDGVQLFTRTKRDDDGTLVVELVQRVDDSDRVLGEVPTDGTPVTLQGQKVSTVISGPAIASRAVKLSSTQPMVRVYKSTAPPGFGSRKPAGKARTVSKTYSWTTKAPETQVSRSNASLSESMEPAREIAPSSLEARISRLESAIERLLKLAEEDR